MPLPSPRRLLGVSLSITLLGSIAGLLCASAPDRLTSRPRPAVAPGKTLAVGDKVSTAAGERRRVLLPNRSIVYLQERSALTVKAEDRILLSAGEAFIETVPGKLAPELRVDTPKREISARDSRFGVHVEEAGTSVLVAAGQARVAGLDTPIRAGQALSASAEKPAPAPRISHLVAWTRELRQAAPLVPASQHSGGTLIARDPDGQEAKLELRRYRIDVHVEDGFARTTIDQTYFNHTQDRLEGTFRFPLPADASLSRLAMYVDGKLMEGGMAERDHARAAYERIRFEQRDPALLEWVDGSTFKMRVFPLEPRQEKRLLLSYTQRLPILYGTHSYRFPAGHSFAQVGEWSLHVRVKGGAERPFNCESHAVRATKVGGDLLLDATQRNARLDRDVVLRLTTEEKPGPEVGFTSAELDGQKYLLVRYRPALAGMATAERRDWVVLVETSGDRDPLLARTQIELLRSLLDSAGRDDTFTLVTAATRTRKLQAKPMLNEPAAVEEALAALEKAHLVGALDLGQALSDVRPLLEASKTPYLLHVGSGIAAMGTAQTKELLALIPKGTRYVGVTVGKRGNRSFMQAAAEATGGYHTQVNPDEPVSWRGMELLMTLNTPRLLDVTVSDAADKITFLPFERMVSQGEELAAIARVTEGMPETVRIKGLLDGKEVVRDVTVKDVQDSAGYLPRSWAKLEIDRLLPLETQESRKAIVELSKALYVMSPFTSLLVLENDDMYRQFKVDRGRKDHWAMYPAKAKIPVVFEPIEGDAGDAKKGIKPSARIVAQSVRTRGMARVLGGAENRRHYTPQSIQAGGSGVATTSATYELRIPRMPPDGAAPVMMRNGTTSGLRLFDDLPIYQRGGEDRPAAPAHGLEGFTAGGRVVEVIDNSESMRDVAAKSSAGTTLLGGLRMRGDGGRRLLSESFTLKALDDSEYGEVILSKIRKGRDVEGRQMELLHSSEDLSAIGYERDRISGREGKPRSQNDSLLYIRPSYSSDDRLFFDLLGYAPGLNSTYADMRAVIELEARVNPLLRCGTVAEGARALFAKARESGWRSLQVPAGPFAPAYRIVFDGSGRHAWERTLSTGLREQVVCDGKTLWHLYPELGLAATRTVSRFHRLALARTLPWVLPLPEDLAHGADVMLHEPNVVAIVPHGTTDAKGKTLRHYQMHLVFKDGQLEERRLIEMPGKKVLRRETISADGTYRVFNSDSKDIVAFTVQLEEAREPALKADVEKLVVVDLPFRTPAHVRQTLKIDKKSYNDLTFDEARQLLASFVANGEGEQAKQVFQQALSRRDERPLGYYVLLSAAGVNLDGDNLDVLDAHPHEPLAQYLALHSSPVLRKHASRWAAASNTFGEGLLRRLALGHALCQRWASGKSLGSSAAQRKGERQRALAYVKRYQGTALAWALLGLVQDRTREETEKDVSRAAYRELADAYGLFTKTPGLGDHARYEQARCLFLAAQETEARKRFLALYEEKLKEEVLLAIDGDFRAALLSGEKDDWTALLRRTAATLIKDKDRVSALLLARQCWQIDDRALAAHLFGLAMKDVGIKGKEDLALQAAALRFLMSTQQTAEAEALVNRLLEDGDNAKRPDLWRVAAQLAGERERPARKLECTEKALELEFSNLPEVINLERVRSDYGGLLNQYETLAGSLATLKLPTPAGFRDKVVRAADRWRALDREQDRASKAASSVLRTLGERELAWDYLTTPVALRPGEATVWLGLAHTLQQQGERDLADRAFQAAFQREATDAQVLWQRADNLRQAGRLTQARKLYRQLAEGDWQPRFATLKTQAKWMLEGKE